MLETRLFIYIGFCLILLTGLLLILRKLYRWVLKDEQDVKDRQKKGLILKFFYPDIVVKVLIS